MKPKTEPTCYACDQRATSREHVPPLSFFPKGHRYNLITVPSCAAHNNDISQDVEYARNIISVTNGVNEVGTQHFLKMGVGSLEHNPALLYTSFSDIRPFSINGHTVGAFTLDTDRIDRVIGAIITALHFHDTGEKLVRWHVVSPNRGFNSRNTTPEEMHKWELLMSIFASISYKPRTTGSPEVFRYAVSDLKDGYVYQLVFYDGYFFFGLGSGQDDSDEVLSS